MGKKARKKTIAVRAPKEDSKICSRCGEKKPRAAFPKAGAMCKKCKEAYHAKWRAKRYARSCSHCGKTKPPGGMQPCQRPYICRECFSKRTGKQCRKCGETKPLTLEFWHEAPEAADGFRGECRDCRAEYDAKSYAVKALDPEYLRKQAEKSNKWYYENRKYALARGKNYNAMPEVQQHRRERDSHRRATDPQYVENNKQRSANWYQSNKDGRVKAYRAERREKRSAEREQRKLQRLATQGGDGPKVLKFANQIGKLRSTPPET
jgi:hypothetical protein